MNQSAPLPTTVYRFGAAVEMRSQPERKAPASVNWPGKLRPQPAGQNRRSGRAAALPYPPEWRRDLTVAATTPAIRNDKSLITNRKML